MQMGAFSFFFLHCLAVGKFLSSTWQGLARTGKNNIKDESQQVFYMLTSNSRSLRTS